MKKTIKTISGASLALSAAALASTAVSAVTTPVTATNVISDHSAGLEYNSAGVGQLTSFGPNDHVITAAGGTYFFAPAEIDGTAVTAITLENGTIEINHVRVDGTVANDYYQIVLNGDAAIAATENVTLPADFGGSNYELVVANGRTLKVNGTLNLGSKAKLVNNGTVEVNGASATAAKIEGTAGSTSSIKNNGVLRLNPYGTLDLTNLGWNNASAAVEIVGSANPQYGTGAIAGEILYTAGTTLSDDLTDDTVDIHVKLASTSTAFNRESYRWVFDGNIDTDNDGTGDNVASYRVVATALTVDIKGLLEANNGTVNIENAAAGTTHSWANGTATALGGVAPAIDNMSTSLASYLSANNITFRDDGNTAASYYFSGTFFKVAPAGTTANNRTTFAFDGTVYEIVDENANIEDNVTYYAYYRQGVNYTVNLMINNVLRHKYVHSPFATIGSIQDPTPAEGFTFAGWIPEGAEAVVANVISRDRLVVTDDETTGTISLVALFVPVDNNNEPTTDNGAEDPNEDLGPDVVEPSNPSQSTPDVAGRPDTAGSFAAEASASTSGLAGIVTSVVSAFTAAGAAVAKFVKRH